jgi:polyisoprenoid-binding protein YceI
MTLLGVEARPQSRTRALLAGVAAGAVAAIVASLISLPLASPDDLLFNTFTVTIGALIAGFGGGFVWWTVRDRPRPVNALWLAAFGALVVVGVVGIVGQIAVLDRLFGFVMILGGTVLAIIALLIPPFTAIRPAWAAVLLVAAIAIGIGFAGQGDEESGELSLSDAPATTEAPQTEDDTPADEAPDVATGEGEDQEPSSAPDSELTLPDDVAGSEYVIASEESEVTYTIDETVQGLAATAVGRTSDLSGTLRLDGTSEVTIDLSTFTSDQSRRDDFVQDRMFSDPVATLSVESLDLPATYTEGDIVETTFVGTFTIQGVSQPVTWIAEARLSGDRLEVAADTDITFSQFELQAPQSGFVQVEDEVRVEVLVVAVA